MVHTHLHTMYSLRDSIIRPEELAKRLKEIGQTAVAVTDHGSSLGGVSIYQLLKANEIKYIHGCEVYICDNISEKDKDSKYYHLVLLCKNDKGRINLNRLISLSNRPENFYYKPRIDFKMLSEHKDGILVTSACIAGEIGRTILSDYQQARETALKYKAEFGNDYFLEIQAHTDNEQIQVNKAVVQLAKELDIPVVVTCDAHYVYEKDRKYQSKYAFGGSYKEDEESYIDCFVQSETEVRERLAYLPQEIVDTAIRNTDIIADRCNVEMPISAPIMPEVKVPAEFKTSKEWLISLCESGAKAKLNFNIRDNKKYSDRLDYEIDMLSRMGFLDYILLVYSYSHKGSIRGIARGSGGGSLVNYLTDITDIDPIEHNLFFERFIDVGAVTALESGEITAKELKIPDIDLDFSKNSCEDVLKWMHDTYGEDKVASIGKFGTNQTKGTIRDMCKVLDIPLETADKIAKSFGEYEIDEIVNMINGTIPIENSAKTAIGYVKSYPELFEYVQKLNGLPKSFGLHACGKIISVRDLDEFLPSCYDKSGIRFLQGDMHDVEDVGLVKVDVLGLRTLDAVYDTLEMSGESKEFLNTKQDFTDDKVLDIFRNGDTVGIFQFSSAGMKQTLKKMDVRGIEDLSIANALYRPGSLKFIDDFCDRRQGKVSFEYLHPDLEPILNNTYGIMVFQEQLIQIGRMAGIHNPDLLRKATGKKNPKLLAQVKPELENKLKDRGWTQQQFDTLWEQMLEFAKYSFNKAHSSAYAILGYMTAKQKAYYPAEFYAGLCNSYIGKSEFVKEEADEIISDAEEHDIKIAPFNFRQDHRKCHVVDGQIVYAIPLIKDCSTACAEAVYECADKQYPNFFSLLSDLYSKGINKKQADIMIKLGFFAEFGGAKFLMKVKTVFESLKDGDIKSITKAKVSDSQFADIFNRYCKQTDKKWSFTSEEYERADKLSKLLQKKAKTNGETADTKTTLESYERIKVAEHDKVMKNVLADIYTILLPLKEDDFSFKQKSSDSLDVLGFTHITTGKEADRRKLFVKSVVPLKNKESKSVWGYAIFTKSIGSGKNGRLTVPAKVYDTDNITKGDIIYATSVNKKGNWWYLNDYSILF